MILDIRKELAFTAASTIRQLAFIENPKMAPNDDISIYR